MNANTLLADPAAIEIEKFVSGTDTVKIVIRSIQQAAICPQCDTASSSLKTRYVRQVADLPWHGVAVRLELHTRKFRCRNELCPRKVFCERLSKVAATYARRTVRLGEMLSLLAFALGGRGGSRAAAKLNFPAGKDTLLGVVRRRRINQTIENEQPVKVLGIDDFAFRKGTTYGTILVDLEKCRAIDLLPDRESATLKKWLEKHPEIETVSRDRSFVYAEAARTGAPQAKQVADRWHLLKNLSEVVEKILLGNQSLLKTAWQETRERFYKIRRSTMPETSFITSTEKSPHSATETSRRKLFVSIKELFENGVGIRRIGRELGINRNTVRKYLRSPEFPQRQTRSRRRSCVQRFGSYLERRWNEGERNAFRLWREISEQGFRGEVTAVRRFVQAWRRSDGQKTVIRPTSLKGYSPRQTTKLLLGEPTKDIEREYIEKLTELNPKIKRVKNLGRQFRQMVREKRAELFDDWLKEVEADEIIELKNWADGLLADERAVRNALSSEWSNGQTEGQVNRLKTIKRQMYGRANFDLLRARVLHQD
jgi:transposase